MNLYNLTLQGPSAIQKAIYGNFTSSKAQELILCRGKSFQMYTVDQKGKFELVCVQQLFCVLRSLIPFRFFGMNHDLLVMGSDSGKIVILQFNTKTNRFVKTHEQTYGRAGCRRIVPGQYLAGDPKGRAFMIAAVQKQKFVYTLNRENQKLIISSPREAHKSHSLCLDVVSLDVGHQNAQFGCLQIDYGETDDKDSLINKGGVRKTLVIYQMDFGMNTVIRKRQTSVPDSAHMLLQVPNLPDGPGGLIIVCQNFLIYKNDKIQKALPIPRRIDRPKDRQSMIVANAFHRQKDLFFYLIQNQLGDLFKINFHLSDKNKSEILSLSLNYFDTTPPCISLCITKNGYLFCASQKSDHILYNFVSNQNKQKVITTNTSMNIDSIIEFAPKKLQNILQTDILQNFSCPTDIKVEDLKEQGNPQIYLLTGSGIRSSLRIIKQGLPIKQLASMKLPKPQAVWTLKGALGQKFDKYIILSFLTATTVLAVSETGSVAEVKDTGIDSSVPTLHIAMLEDESIIQIVSNGYRHIKKDRKIAKMSFEGKILKAATNLRQMTLALAGGDLIYYELDNTGNLNDLAQTNLDSQISSLDIGPIPHGRKRSNFLAVGLSDHTTRIFDLSPESCLKKLSIQTFPCAIESVAIIEMMNDEVIQQILSSQLYLYVGLQNGLLMRTTIDVITGKLADTRPRFLGIKPVKCFKTNILGKPGLLALSSRPWLIYNYMEKYSVALLAYFALDYASPFCTGNCQNGLIGLYENCLKVLSIQNFGELFHSEKISLTYTPRKMLITKKLLIILQYDQRTYQQQQLNIVKGSNYNPNNIPQKIIGQVFAPPNTYAAQIRIFNPKNNTTHQIIKLQKNQICVSICELQIKSDNQSFVCVGCTKNLINKPKKSFTEASINVYAWDNGKLVLYHKTIVQDIPYALHGWRQKLISGIGNSLRAYQMGKKKLLRKAELKSLNSPVNSIHSQGQRIFATQIADSFHIYKFKTKQQTFYDIADDVLPRYITSSALLDYHTMIGGDKFQNIFISRAPNNADQDYENNPNSYKFRWQNGYLNGAPFKMEQICNFYVGQIVTCMQKTSLVSTGSEIIVYCTANGSICALYPFETREDIDFFQHLQMFLRAEVSPLGGRDHLGFRSFYSPCKGIIDGDLCQQYQTLSYETQIKLGKYLDRNPQQVHKKLEQIRNKIL